jgi:hypothetical protein
MSRFNKLASEKNIAVNLAGGYSFTRPPKEELMFAVLTSFLENKFYESGSDRLQRIVVLVKAVNDPIFIAKLAKATRTIFHLRSTYHTLVGELAKINKGNNLVSNLIEQTTERPDDLTELIAYIGKPIPNQIKKGIAKALRKFNQYQLTKYKQAKKEVSLCDLFNLVHPKPKDKIQAKMWGSLLKGELKPPDTWEVLLSTTKDKASVWRQLIMEDRIGYMALLRNLRNIDQQTNNNVKKRACETIANKERVLKSKQLPFRFYSAYAQVDNQDMLEAISQAMEHSLLNIPQYDGETLIAVDVSGSMSGKPIEIASIFAGALWKANNAELVLYDTNLQRVKLLKATPIIQLAEKIQQLATGGGTQTSLVFDYATQTGKKYNRIIILSDNESWVESYFGNRKGAQTSYNQYRKINDPFIYAIDIEGYGTSDLKNNKVFHITGWSDKIFDLMKFAEKKNVVNWVEEINF